MKRLIVAAGIALAFLLPTTTLATQPPNHQVWVCKYVGQPGDFETLKPGKNPIIVEVAAADYFVGADFADGQNHSFVIDLATDANTGQGETYTGEATCPTPPEATPTPPEATPTPTPTEEPKPTPTESPTPTPTQPGVDTGGGGPTSPPTDIATDLTSGDTPVLPVVFLIGAIAFVAYLVKPRRA